MQYAVSLAELGDTGPSEWARQKPHHDGHDPSASVTQASVNAPFALAASISRGLPDDRPSESRVTLAVPYRRTELKFVYETTTLRLPSDERRQHKRNKGSRTYRGSDGDLHLRCPESLVARTIGRRVSATHLPRLCSDCAYPPICACYPQKE